MRHPRRRGFTLVEILVVIVIIGIVATGVLLAVSVTGRDRELESETERLVALMNFAREQAELQTRELGLLCREDGYGFLAFDPRRGLWDITDDEALRSRELPDGLRLRLIVEARNVLLREAAQSETPMPHIMIFSNGDLTPFELAIEREGTGRRMVVIADEQGQITTRVPEEHAG